MATETPTDSLERSSGHLLRRVKDGLFEALLVVSTLIGIVSLLILVGHVFFDALGPTVASPQWYLLYFATLVLPASLFALYVRGRPAARRVSDRSFAAAFGGLTLVSVSYVVAEALSPYDVLIFLVFGAVPPLFVWVYGRFTSERMITGPAIPIACVVSILGVFGLRPVYAFFLEPVHGPVVDVLVSLVGVAPALEPVTYLVGVAIPVGFVVVYGRYLVDDLPVVPAAVAAVVGLVATDGVYDYVRPVAGDLPTWVAYFGIIGVPVAAIVGVAVARRRTREAGLNAAIGVAVACVLATLTAQSLGYEPSFSMVFVSGFVVPAAYVVATALADGEGRLGVLGPFVLIGGTVLGARLERVFGIVGLDSYLTPTLLLESWHSLDASEAGVYPQTVGSIIIVAVMAVMAFPVGVGAALYLEEYAPSSGWRGRLASVLEVNISNLAGVPSVVYGLLGLALFRNTLGFESGIVLAASGTLGLLILPIVVVSAQEAIRAVPDSYRRAAYGMGASRWQTLRSVVLPEAFPGILTGTILALGRAIGETAPLVIIAVATTTYSAPDGLFSSATALPLQIFASAGNARPEFREGVVAATAILLLALMLIMNATAIVLRNRYQTND